MPKKWLLRSQLPLRYLASIPYRGKKVQCNICETGLKKFITLPTDLLCPRCGSRSRTRQLYSYINDNNLLIDHVLHFSPNYYLSRKLKKSTPHYKSTDYLNEFNADLKLDITDIALPSASQDLIICYHVLEHIVNDKKAIAELLRIKKADGSLLIQTPFKAGAIYEDASIVSKEERLKEYGQEDHVRIYSVDGLKQRIKSIDTTCIIKVVQLEKNSYHGMNTDILLHIS